MRAGLGVRRSAGNMLSAGNTFRQRLNDNRMAEGAYAKAEEDSARCHLCGRTALYRGVRNKCAVGACADHKDTVAPKPLTL